MRSMNAKYAIYAAVSVASFVLGSAVMTKADPTPSPAPSTTASASATASPKATGTSAPLPLPTGSGLPSGFSVQGPNGKVNVPNGTGTPNFVPGQFGVTPAVTQPPIIVPSNPGMQFVPPPTFSPSSPGGTPVSKPGSVDCIVR